MKIGVNIERRVARMDQAKANRLRTVASLPDTAEQGDMVLMGGQLHVHSEGAWQNIDAVLLKRVEALEEAQSNE